MVEEARRYLAKGEFPPGPKILAAVEFVKQGGRRVVVCRPECVMVEALCGTNLYWGNIYIQ